MLVKITFDFFICEKIVPLASIVTKPHMDGQTNKLTNTQTPKDYKNYRQTIQSMIKLAGIKLNVPKIHVEVTHCLR